MSENVQFMWKAGDPWRDLTAELSVPVTVVSWNGTSHLLDATAGWQRRVPLEGGHTIFDDQYDRPLDEIVFASPCEVRLNASDRWHITSRLVAILAGHHPG